MEKKNDKQQKETKETVLLTSLSNRKTPIRGTMFSSSFIPKPEPEKK